MLTLGQQKQQAKYEAYQRLSPAEKEAQQQAYVQGEINKEYIKALSEIDNKIDATQSSIQSARNNINNLQQQLERETYPLARTNIVRDIRTFEQEINNLQQKLQVYVSSKGLPPQQLIGNIDVIESNASARYEESYRGHMVTPTVTTPTLTTSQQIQELSKIYPGATAGELLNVARASGIVQAPVGIQTISLQETRQQAIEAPALRRALAEQEAIKKSLEGKSIPNSLTPYTPFTKEEQLTSNYYRETYGENRISSWISKSGIGKLFREVKDTFVPKTDTDIMMEVLTPKMEQMKPAPIEIKEGFISSRFGFRTTPSPQFAKKETMVTVPKQFAEVTPEAQYYTKVLTTELPKIANIEQIIKDKSVQLQKLVEAGKETVESANRQLKEYQDKKIEEYNSGAKERETKIKEEVYGKAEGPIPFLKKIEYKPYAEAEKQYKSSLVQSLPPGLRAAAAQAIKYRAASGSFVVGAYEGIRTKPVTTLKTVAVGAVTAAVGYFTGGTVVAPLVTIGGRVLGTTYFGGVALRVGLTPGFYEKFEKAGEITGTEIVPFGIGMRGGKATATSTTSYKELRLLEQQGLIKKGEAGISARREFVNQLIAFKPKEAGIVPIKNAKGEDILYKQRKGKPEQVDESTIIALRNIKSPGVFKVIGGTTYYIPIKTTYKIGMFEKGGYKERKIVLQDAALQKFNLGKNLFVSTTEADLIRTRGIALRSIETVSPRYFQKGKFSLGKDYILEEKTQKLTGETVSKKEEGTETLLSQLGKEKIVSKEVKEVPSQFGKIFEANIKGKRGKEGVATIFEKPSNIITGKGEFKISTLAKRTYSPEIRKSKYAEAESQIFKTTGKAPGVKATAMGESYGFMTKADTKISSGYVDGKKAEIITTIVGGRARGAISTKSTRPIILRLKTIDISPKKFEASGGGKGGEYMPPEEGGSSGGSSLTFEEPLKNKFMEETTFGSLIAPGKVVSLSKPYERVGRIQYSSRGISLSKGLTQAKSLSLLKTNSLSIGLISTLTPLTSIVGISTLASTQTSALVSTQVQTPVQVNVPVQIGVFAALPGISPGFKFKPIEPPKPPRRGGFFFPREAQKTQEQKAYYPEVRIDATKGVKAHWERVSNLPQTKESAISQAAQIVDKTISAKARVVPAPKEKVAVDTGNRFFEMNRQKFRGHQIKRGKKIVTPNQIIELQKYRADSPQEVLALRKGKAEAKARRTPFGF